MILKSLKSLFHRDLSRLKKEIEAYQKEKNIWKVEKNINNSAGNLCLHLVGNLKAFIGAVFAKTDYTRNKDYEFSAKNVSRQELIKGIEEVMVEVDKGLNVINREQLSDDYPIKIWDKSVNMGYTLIHLYGHLNYHLGQVNYHRRLIE